MGAMQVDHRSRSDQAHHLSPCYLLLCQPAQHHPSGTTIACYKTFYGCYTVFVLGFIVPFLVIFATYDCGYTLAESLMSDMRGVLKWDTNLVVGLVSGWNWRLARIHSDVQFCLIPQWASFGRTVGYHKDSLVCMIVHCAKCCHPSKTKIEIKLRIHHQGNVHASVQMLSCLQIFHEQRSVLAMVQILSFSISHETHLNTLKNVNLHVVSDTYMFHLKHKSEQLIVLEHPRFCLCFTSDLPKGDVPFW